MPHQTPDTPTPVTILTGFLGAGKTTLLNRILCSDHGLRVAVMVNDFGAINIDSEMIVAVEGDSVSLANGCICCTIRDDLLIAALKLLSRPEPPQYLLIEASGVSDPVAIAATFLLPELRPLITLDSIITVVDAEQVLDQLQDLRAVIEDQVYAADLVVLNKVDLVGDAQLGRVRAWVHACAPRARVLEARHADVPLGLLLGVGRYRLSLEPMVEAQSHTHDHDTHDHHHHHGEEFASWSYACDRPLALRPVREMLKHLPLSIVRAKGLLYVSDLPDRRVVFHLVGRRMSIVVGEPWGATSRQTKLVAIGLPGRVDAAMLTANLDACQAASDTHPPLPVAWEWSRGRRIRICRRTHDQHL